MTTRTYRSEFLVAVFVGVLLAAALVYVIARSHLASRTEPPVQDPVVARGPDSNHAPASPQGGPAATSEPALSPIQLSPQRMQEIGVTLASVEFKQLSDKLSVPGTVDINEQGLAYVQTRFAGWIQTVSANATYQYVRKGEPLFTIYSPDIISSEQEYLLAAQNQTSFSHDSHGVAMYESDWLLHAAEDRLRQYGISDREIGELQHSGKVRRDIAIDSPVSGYVTERNVLPNAYVQPEMKLYTIADLSTVWVYANVAQVDVGRLKTGDTAQVTVDAYPGRKFNGRIDRVLPQVDPATRTVRVRVVLANPAIALKPGMFVNVDIAASLGRQLVLPSSAVLQAGTRTIAFVDHGEGNLEPRAIETGPTVDQSVVVLKGLKPHDRVVSSANFLVDSEAQLQASMGRVAPTPQQADVSSASAAAPQLRVDFSTQPSPPRKGANTVRIRLTAADGKPLAGVQVTALFFMPAMPAMGMAAGHAQAALADKGDGVYEGSVDLPSGGTWQVTVSAQHGSQTVATKQFTVSAAGGM